MRTDDEIAGEIEKLIAEAFDKEGPLRWQGMAITAAFQQLDGESRVVVFAPPEQSSWETMGLMETALVYERERTRQCWREAEDE